MAYDPEAQYNQTVADLNLQAGWEEGGLTESDTNLKANEGFQESELTRAEPGTYRAGTNAANRGGLLTSGINAHRKEGVAANFAARRVANQRALQEGENRIKREREGGQLKRTERLHGAEEIRAREKDRIGKEEAAANAAAAASAPQAPTPGAAPGAPFWNPGYGPQYQTYPTQSTYKNPPKKKGK